MATLKIIGLCTLAAICYGVVHDQITARLCIEYFTVFHPRLVASTSPTVLGLVWGVVATWWVGAGLGVLLALTGRLGRWPKVEPGTLLRPVLILLCVAGCCAVLAGLVGDYVAREQIVVLPAWVQQKLGSDTDPSKAPRFLSAFLAHNTSYNVGAIGGLVIAVRVVLRRRRLAMPGCAAT